jgi:DNA polymerase-3 subunit gamma/tau
MLSTSAFNALLKILEEPPEYIIFILATTELRKIPDTVISRCQRFDFKKVAYEEMKKYLEKVAKEEKIKVDKEVIDKIINKSDSCVRDAVSLLDQVMATGEKHITAEIASVVLPSSNVDETINFISFLINKEAAEAIKQVNKMTDEGVSLNQFINDTVELLRIMMITKVNFKTESLGLDLSNDAEKTLLKLNKNISSAEIIILIDLLLKRRLEIKNTPIPQLPLELAIIEWCESEQSEQIKPVHHASLQGVAGGQSKQITQTKQEVQVEKKEEIKEEIKINPIIETEEKPISANNTLTIKDIENKWGEFISKIEKKSTSLAFILKSASLGSISDNKLCFTVSFALHKEKILDKVCKRDIESVLSEVMNERIRIDAVVTEKKEIEEKEIDTELQDLTAAFGGEIVN